MKRKRIMVMVVLMAILVVAIPSARAVKPFWSLTGTWGDSRGGQFYVRMDGNVVVWYGKGGSGRGFWHHVGTGNIQGNFVQATYRDIPGSNWPNAGGSIRGNISQNWSSVSWDRMPPWRRLGVLQEESRTIQPRPRY